MLMSDSNPPAFNGSARPFKSAGTSATYCSTLWHEHNVEMSAASAAAYVLHIRLVARNAI